MDTDISKLIPVPLTVRTDPDHGGRWTSLHGGGREWLWHRDEPRRAQVSPGEAFADAGGLEECVPTVRGTPDHGDAWSRAWTTLDEHGNAHLIHCADFTLTRAISVHDSAIVADYLLVADPGYRFVWAGHALLELSPGARLETDDGAQARLFPEAAPYLRTPWPDGAAWIEGEWPAPAGRRLDSFGPDDGTAVGAILHGAAGAASATAATTASALVADGPDFLHLTVTADAQPASIALWRNLGGFPGSGPYRSIGVEPMLGRVFDLDDAHAGDCAVTPASGEVRWRLSVAAYRRTERN
jgi:hypothetical protein